MLKRLNLYVIHARDLSHRMMLVNKVLDLLKKAGNAYEKKVYMMTAHDPEEVAPRVQQLVARGPDDALPEPFKHIACRLHVKHVSNAMKHLACLQRIAESQEDDETLNVVIEDDVIVDDSVHSELEVLGQKYLRLSREDRGVVFLGLPNRPETPLRTMSLVKNVFTMLPCCDSYCVSPGFAKKLCEAWLPIRFPTNVHFSYVLARVAKGPDMTHAWKPNLFLDGSKVGVCVSVLNSDNRLLWVQPYMMAYDVLQRCWEKKRDMTGEEEARVVDCLSKMAHVKHPDAIALQALYRLVAKDYKKSKAQFEAAMEAYEKEGSMMNMETKFLKQYASLFAHVQEDI